MKKRLVAILCSLVLVSSAFCCISASADSTEKIPSVDASEQVEVVEPSVDGVTIARFENMLNHNYIYDDDFLDDKSVIENSILSLLEYVHDGEINKELTLNFITNMYGREVDPNAAVYDFLPASEGNFAVIPRGYTVYSHKITSVVEIECGYLVRSEMTIDPHDDTGYTVSVESVFVPNEGSSYGYNLIKSNILQADSVI